jgi:hypothetical protein
MSIFDIHDSCCEHIISSPKEDVSPSLLCDVEKAVCEHGIAMVSGGLRRRVLINILQRLLAASLQP